MKCISVRQPWAWLIIHGGKDIENRTWRTDVHGRVLIHAAKGMTQKEYDEARYFTRFTGETIPPFDDLKRGGIIGSVDIVGCVRKSNSPWFHGPWGFAMRDPQPMEFRPMKGRLGFWEVEL